jgi:hypothetical protein
LRVRDRRGQMLAKHHQLMADLRTALRGLPEKCLAVTTLDNAVAPFTG